MAIRKRSKREAKCVKTTHHLQSLQKKADIAARIRAESKIAGDMAAANGVIELPRTAKLEFIGVPDQVRVVIEPWMLRYGSLLPTWVQHVRVKWDARGDENDSGKTIAIVSQYDYRFIELTFYPLFLGQRPDEQQWQVMHDLLHAFAAPLTDWAEDTIKLLLRDADDSKFRASLLEALREREESFVQDLALRLAEVL